MLQLKARIARVEDRSRQGDNEETFPFGGDVVIQDYELVENEDGEALEVPMGEVRREFVMHPECIAKTGQRLLGFEPLMITQAQFNSVLVAIMNTSRSI